MRQLFPSFFNPRKILMPRPEICKKLDSLGKKSTEEHSGRWSHTEDYFAALINPKKLGLPEPSRYKQKEPEDESK